MKYSAKLTEGKRYCDNFTAFGGLKESAKPNELKSSVNVRTDFTGAIVSRPRRVTVRDVHNGGGIFSDDGLCYIENNRFYYGGNEVEGVFLTSGKKQICRLSKYILIFPDGIYINVSDLTDFGSINTSFITTGIVSLFTVNEKLNPIENYGISPIPPENASYGTYHVFISDKGNYVMKFYDGHKWNDVKTYILLSAKGIGASFKKGDILEVEGGDGILPDKSQICYLNNDEIYFEGVAVQKNIRGLTLRRPLPLLDKVTVSNGRVFGCRYGKNRKGEFVSRIYASAKNNPLCWCIAENGGISCDIEGSGEFCSINDFLGNPVVFRRDSITEININSSNTLISTVIKCEGTEYGAYESVVGINGVIYYKGRNGIYAYDGTYPKCISKVLGKVRSLGNGENCPGGCFQSKYYCCFALENDERAIYIYDPEKDEWYKENDFGVTSFAMRNGILYAMSGGENGKIVLIDGENLSTEEKEYLKGAGYPKTEDFPEWEFTLGYIDKEDLKAVRPSKLTLRFEGNFEKLTAGVTCNDKNQPYLQTTIEETGYKNITMPVSRIRSDCIGLCVKGKGNIKITGYSVEYRKEGAVRGWK